NNTIGEFVASHPVTEERGQTLLGHPLDVFLKLISRNRLPSMRPAERVHRVVEHMRPDAVPQFVQDPNALADGPAIPFVISLVGAYGTQRDRPRPGAPRERDAV